MHPAQHLSNEVFVVEELGWSEVGFTDDRD